MKPMFEELDYQKTDLGELILQRRTALELDGRDVYEVRLDTEYLMTTLFFDGEVALTRLGLDALSGGQWDVVVGGLGLGFTAVAALDYAQVASLMVVEALAPVIEWHERALVPNGARLSGDTRCRYHHADFFALARGQGFDPDVPGRRYDAILLDIDHTPDALLNPSHADCYTLDGLQRLKAFLKPGGVFALWSNDAPDPAFSALLKQVFDSVEGHTVSFDNPLQGNTAINGVYVSRVSAA